MWQVRIEDPSGETRVLSLKAQEMKIGRGQGCEIPLRDPLVSFLDRCLQLVTLSTQIVELNVESRGRGVGAFLDQIRGDLP